MLRFPLRILIERVEIPNMCITQAIYPKQKAVFLLLSCKQV